MIIIIVRTIITLAVLIISHELGHFLVAKWAGIQVDEFGLGLPPRAWGKKIGETIYSLNWIPFGGFVRIAGEDGTDADTKVKPSGSDSQGLTLGEGSLASVNGARFTDKSRWVQAGVVVAGIVFNILFALVLIWVALQSGLTVSVGDFANQKSHLIDERVLITGVGIDSPAELAHVPTGASISNFKTPEEVIAEVAKSAGKSVTLVTSKGTFVITPNPKLGISMDLVADAHLPFFASIPVAISTTYHATINTASGIAHFLWGLVTKSGTINSVSGPVGIAGVLRQASDIGFATLIYIVALISLSLAVINLIPFPALDGGRLLVIIIEGLRKKAVNQRVINIVNTAGFALLILLMVFVTYHDIVKLISPLTPLK